MIFQDELIEKILAGEKTVTRRPVKYTESGKLLPCKRKVGRDYALQGPPEKGSKARARTIPGYRLLFISIGEPELAWDLTDAEARLEGFNDQADFRLYFLKLYGRKASSLLCRRIEFELLRDKGEGEQ